MNPRIRIFISSPGDVATERRLANRLVQRLADEFIDRVFVAPVFWEDLPLRATGNFAEEIPRPSECEIVLCILWSRLGTRLPPSVVRPDGSRYDSGTEYEFEEAYAGFKKNGRPDLLVYRKTAAPLVSLDDDAELQQRREQKKLLTAFVEKWFAGKDGIESASHTFETSGQFESMLGEHLRRLIQARLPVAEQLPVTWKGGSPFRGLEVFDREHAEIFFGRTAAVAAAIESLRNQNAAGRSFLMIVGASGAGKSSVARAGLLPRLIQPGVIDGVDMWRTAALRPTETGGDIILSLATALLSSTAVPELGRDGTTAEKIRAMLRSSPKSTFALVKGGLSQAAATFASSNKPVSEVSRRAGSDGETSGHPDPAGQQLEYQPQAHMVLLVDQLEEIFTHPAVTADDRRCFVACLADLATSGRVWVVTTLRSDLYRRCAELPELLTIKSGQGQFDLPLPTPAEIGQMIRRPARAAGLRFEDDTTTKQPLDEALRDAAVSSPEILPMLEFALDELYKRKTDAGLLTWDQYRKIGGVEGALASRAEEVFNTLVPEVQACFESVMQQLVSVGEDGVVSRRQIPRASLAQSLQMQQFVDAFVKARLLSADRLADGTSVVRLPHDALLRLWPRLSAWVTPNREDLQIAGRIAAAAERWEKSDRRSDLLLNEGKPLEEARRLSAEVPSLMSPVMMEMLEASEARAFGRRRLKRLVIAGLVLLSVTASAAAILASHERGLAIQMASRAKRSEAVAEQSEQAARHELLLTAELVSAIDSYAPNSPSAFTAMDNVLAELKTADVPDATRARLIEQIGRIYDNLGNPQKGVATLQYSLALMQKLPAPDQAELAENLNHLAWAYLHSGDPKSGQQPATEAYLIMNKLEGPQSENTIAYQADVTPMYEQAGGVGDRIGEQLFLRMMLSFKGTTQPSQPQVDALRKSISDRLDEVEREERNGRETNAFSLIRSFVQPYMDGKTPRIRNRLPLVLAKIAEKVRDRYGRPFAALATGRFAKQLAVEILPPGHEDIANVDRELAKLEAASPVHLPATRE
jgi:hypothetical protein